MVPGEGPHLHNDCGSLIMGLGRVIGGALQGYGSGVAEQARLDIAERREMALAKLRQENALALENQRSQNSIAEGDARAQNQDILDERSLNRRTEAELKIGAQAGQFKSEQARLEAEAKKIEGAAERAHEIRMAKLKGEQERLTAKARAEIDAGEVKDSRVSESGEIILITKGGQTTKTGIKATEKDRIHNPNGGLGGLVIPPQQPAQEAAAVANVVSRAQVESYAKNYGMTYEEAARVLRGRGATIQ